MGEAPAFALYLVRQPVARTVDFRQGGLAIRVSTCNTAMGSPQRHGCREAVGSRAAATDCEESAGRMVCRPRQPAQSAGAPAGSHCREHMPHARFDNRSRNGVTRHFCGPAFMRHSWHLQVQMRLQAANVIGAHGGQGYLSRLTVHNPCHKLPQRLDRRGRTGCFRAL